MQDFFFPLAIGIIALGLMAIASAPKPQLQPSGEVIQFPLNAKRPV